METKLRWVASVITGTNSVTKSRPLVFFVQYFCAHSVIPLVRVAAEGISLVLFWAP